MIAPKGVLAEALSRRSQEIFDQAEPAIQGLRRIAATLHLTVAFADFDRVLARLAKPEFNPIGLGIYRVGKTTLLSALLGRPETSNADAGNPILATDHFPGGAPLITVRWGKIPQVNILCGDGGRTVSRSYEWYLEGLALDEDGKAARPALSPADAIELIYPTCNGRAGLVVVDTPSFEEYVLHSLAQMEAYRHADAGIMVYSTNAAFSMAELNFACELRKKYLTSYFMVVNLWSGRPVIDKLRQMAWENLVGDPQNPTSYDGRDFAQHRIFFVDVGAAQQAVFEGDAEKLSASRFLALEYALMQFYERERSPVHVDQCIALAEKQATILQRRGEALVSMMQIGDKTRREDHDNMLIEIERYRIMLAAVGANCRQASYAPTASREQEGKRMFDTTNRRSDGQTNQLPMPSSLRPLPSVAWEQWNKAVAEMARIAAAAAAALGPDAKQALARVGSSVVSKPARLVFYGRFSVGKSTVLNSLTGRQLLPTDLVAETGIPCELRHGSRDHLMVKQAPGRIIELPCEADLITKHASLLTADGRPNGNLAERIIVELADFPGGPALWIDVPGIDSGSEAACAYAEADNADLLVCVLSSQSFSSLTELKEITTHLRRFGPNSVLLLLNVFLNPGDPATSWREFLAARLPGMMQRLQDGLAAEELPFSWSPRVVVMSAQEAARHPNGFGRPELISYLKGFSAPDLGVLRSQRVSRCIPDLATAEQSVTAVLQATLAENKLRSEAIAARDQRLQSDSHIFERRARAAVAQFFENFQTSAQIGAGKVAGEITNENLDRSGAYTGLLASALADSLSQPRAELISALAQSGRDINWTWDRNCHQAAITAALVTSAVTVNVPKTESGGGVVGAAVGGALGAVLGFGWGAVPAAILGAKIGSSITGSKSVAADVEDTKVNLRAAARQAVEQLAQHNEQLVQLIISQATAYLPTLQSPNVQTVTELTSMVENLKSMQRLAGQLLVETRP